MNTTDELERWRLEGELDRVQRRLARLTYAMEDLRSLVNQLHVLLNNQGDHQWDSTSTTTNP